MNVVPTAHNQAQIGDIASTVLMSGDPLRAKMIAENYLDHAVCYNTVRGMYGYTGSYKGKKISVQGHGMGIPSIGIYSYELYHFYGVDQIIRLGTAGALREDIRMRDIVVAMGASTDSNYASQYDLPGTIAPICSYRMLSNLELTAVRLGIDIKVGNVLSTDIFYHEADLEPLKKWAKINVLAVEMEAAALYLNAANAGKDALCLLTISDRPLTGEATSAEARQNSFLQMVELALETVS